MPLNFQKLFHQYLELVDNLIPKPAAVPLVGIDIGTNAVKAIVTSPVGNDVQIDSWCVEPIKDGNIKDALKTLLGNIHYSAEQVALTSVSGKGTLIRYVEMPLMPIEDLRKSFAFELDKYFPFDPQSIYTDCAILERRTKEKKMSVLLAAVKKDIVEERRTVFKEAGVDLAYISINAIAVANAFERLGPELGTGANAKAILDVGGSVSNLLIIKELSPRFTRDIFIGSDEITKQISNILGVDAAQAEALKLTGEGSSQLTEACEAAVSNLVGEIRLSLDYFMTEKNIQVDEFYLLGGGSLLKGINSIFEKQLGMPVKIWDPLARARLSPSLLASDIKNYSGQLGVAIGLGLTSV
jgi:type IV pilus assembly protein PilM